MLVSQLGCSLNDDVVTQRAEIQHDTESLTQPNDCYCIDTACCVDCGCDTACSAAANRASMFVYLSMPLSLWRHTVSLPLSSSVPPCCTSRLGSGGLSSLPGYVCHGSVILCAISGTSVWDVRWE